MRIGLLVLTVNRSKMLCEMLQSIQRQTFTEYKCIVLDNGSSDDTCSIFAEKFGSDPRFEIDSWAPRSSEENFQRAIKIGQSQFDWFAMLHDDDFLLPTWLETGFSAIQKYPDSNLVSINARAFNSESGETIFHWYPPKNKVIRLADIQEFALWMMKYGSVNFPSVLYSKTSLPQGFQLNNPFGKASDQFVLLEAGKSGPVVVVMQPHYEYRIHTSQDSTSIPEGDVYSKCEYIANHLNWQNDVILRMKRNSFLLRNYIHYRKLKGDESFGGWWQFLSSRNARLITPLDLGRIALMYAQNILRRKA